MSDKTAREKLLELDPEAALNWVERYHTNDGDACLDCPRCRVTKHIGRVQYIECRVLEEGTQWLGECPALLSALQFDQYEQEI